MRKTPSNRNVSRIRIACCGFPVSKNKYYKKFDLVELQKTFYQPPAMSTVEKWREETPPNFEFTLKAWQLIMHPPTSPTYRKLRTPISDDKKENYGSLIREKTKPLPGKLVVMATRNLRLINGKGLSEQEDLAALERVWEK